METSSALAPSGSRDPKMALAKVDARVAGAKKRITSNGPS